MIEIENLTKSYGNFTAVNNVSFVVQPGEIFGFLGVNGAGKTTTLKMLAGVLKPSSGTIRIGRHDMASDSQAAKRITGYIPDRPYLYNKLTGREFLYFIADLYSVPQKRAEERIDQLLEEYGLTRWQDELVESYSHGMKQRLATCAALVHDPEVLIVDEPMVGLDPHGAKFLKQAFRRYADSGMSILLSTHSLNVAEEVADRLAIIHDGNLIAAGTLEHIRIQTGSIQIRLEEMFLQLTSSYQG
ncbi:MAG: ABC transporter ATP-binding protein [Deltaproteobacteria bacterium]|nr:ABC transporter ATP-binding protein [Deltaproteobacteria bacterium]